MTTGFEGAAQQVGGLHQQAQSLRAAVDSGQFHLDPDAADRLARFYKGKADDVARQQAKVQLCVAHGAYGDCQIGQQMDQKMQNKIQDSRAGIVAILKQSHDILKNMEQTVRDAAKDHQNTEAENARQIRKAAEA
jgi:hypothetical protein